MKIKTEKLHMSTKEINRVHIMMEIKEKKLTIKEAAGQLCLSNRQTKRLVTQLQRKSIRKARK